MVLWVVLCAVHVGGSMGGPCQCGHCVCNVLSSMNL